MRSRHFKSGAAKVFVDNGFDQHSLVISVRTLARIQAGKPVILRGQGFPVEGVMERDHWCFNSRAFGSVQVVTDQGRDVFEGNLRDAEVAVVGPPEGDRAKK